MGTFFSGCFTGSFVTFVAMCMAFYMSGGGDNHEE